MDLRPDKAQPEDLSTLVALEKAGFSHPDYADAILKRRQYRYLLARQSADILVLRSRDGTPVASAVVLYRKNAPHARLYSLTVAPSLQGRGAGTSLMRFVEESVLARGKYIVRLEMRANDARLKTFYTKLNYEVIKCAPCYYNKSEAALIMQKRLRTEHRTQQGQDH